YWPYAGNRKAANLSRDAIRPYTALMAASQPMISQQVLSAYSFRGHRCLLDIGGGDGSFIIAVTAQAPKLRCVLLDLPAVADQASERFRAEGLSSRAVAIGGSFLANRLPEGADIVSLVRVMHDHDDADVMTLLRAVHSSLPM
ncbi:methyltransferase, partial [Xanthomonas citri pv. citri]